ncbi:MAG TPA: serine/threonine-protein phosphatase [Lachnospiraceae bacterium]|nr:serine/threonine-protein phosphatase [Lachnospiraceae bacterium]
MKYDIEYACICNVGKRRQMNQDNFICNGIIRKENETIRYPLTGCLKTGEKRVFGVFDGMGGEQKGEQASLIAAMEALFIKETEQPVKELERFCTQANKAICEYADENNIYSTGTTAALLMFCEKEIALCNIGDSKIFRWSMGKMSQISVDHSMPSPFGGKAPLSQNLGIPEDEMLIEPYVAIGKYHNKDIYLICSDGLTDMVPEPAIAKILSSGDIRTAVEKLEKAALDNGGKDNLTIILCKVKWQRPKFSDIFGSK